MPIFYRNEYLFSEIYLKEITEIEEDPSVIATLSTLKEYREYANIDTLQKWNKSFIHEVLKALQFGLRVVNDNLVLLHQLGSPDQVISICYSLLPSEDLDNTLMGKNWAEKIIRNLRRNNLKWGILTNGNRWRIYHTEESTPYENYLEIDLAGVLNSENIQQFQIFYKFMKAENFVVNENSICQFDIFKKESQDKINYIEEELKNALKQKEEGGKGILSNLCMGYVDYLHNKEKTIFDEKIRNTIYGSAMLYMFRLLFLFYAKARGLLSDTDQKGFLSILEIARKKQENSSLSRDSYELWVNLRTIFSNIDLTYNGGLFNPGENIFTNFIEENKIADLYLGSSIYYTTYYEKEAGKYLSISYRDMGVRHLGTLYEGLLEHRLFVAEEDTEVKVSKKEVRFIPVSEGGKIVQGRYIPKGEVYFATDKGERKSSGSYYTPEHIVDYIVNNTVGTKLKEMREEFIKNNQEIITSLETTVNKSEKSSLTELLKTHQSNFIQDKILKLSVLDPAMGSGHFLVNATNNISNFLTEFYNEFDIVTDEDTSIIIWRRRIVENCIYGVDINPLAVELANLSLWILSMAKDKPLSFVNHHLKRGNSLIGAQLADVGRYPDTRDKKNKDVQLKLFDNNEKFKATVAQATSKYKQIKSHDSKSLSDIGQKRQWLDESNIVLAPYKAVCDLHTSICLRNDISEDEYQNIISSFSNEYSWTRDHFFHWELEFSEIFFEHYDRVKEDPGFGVIIVNPPYVGEKGHKEMFREIKQCPLGKYYQGKMDLFYFFFHLALNIGKKSSRIAFITTNYFPTADGARKLREDFKNRAIIRKLINFNELKIFESAAGQHNMITVLSKGHNNAVISENCITRKTGTATDKILRSIASLQNKETEYFNVPQKDLYDGKESYIRLTGYFGEGGNSVQEILEKVKRQGELLINLCRINNGIHSEADYLSPKKYNLRDDKNAQVGDGIYVLNKENGTDNKQISTILGSKEESKCLKPFFKNSDIYKWFTSRDTDKKIIYLNKRNDNISDLPFIKKHLFKFKTIIDKSSDNSPYLHRPKTESDFLNPKIVAPQRSNKNTFGYNEIPWYASADVYFITEKDKSISLKYILALLNSKLYYLWLYYRGKRKGRALELYQKPLSEIPIKKVSSTEQKSVIDLVDRILAITKDDDYLVNSDKQAKVKEYAQQIDQLVYKLYGLTEEEIKIVERETQDEEKK